MYVKFACGHWRRHDAESILMVCFSQADARRGASGRAVPVMDPGKASEIAEVRSWGLRWCCGTRPKEKMVVIPTPQLSDACAYDHADGGDLPWLLAKR